jgi:hypothetical protein
LTGRGNLGAPQVDRVVLGGMPLGLVDEERRCEENSVNTGENGSLIVAQSST